MKSLIVFLTERLVRGRLWAPRLPTVATLTAALMILGSSARAAVTFSAGGGDVNVGSQITIPVTVTGFSDVGGVQLDLTYDPELLLYQPPAFNLGLPGLLAGYIGNPSPGIIRLVWDNPDPIETYPTGVSVPDGTTLFVVQFLANASLGSSPIGFEVTELFDYQLPEPNPIGYSLVGGTVNVVPEPINIALGVFAGLFAGTTTLRWALKKRSNRSTA